jgi:predicted DNA-binding transcriptional regulator AlpA
MKTTTSSNQSDSSAADPLQLLTTRDLMALLRLKNRLAVWRLVNKKSVGFPKALLLGERQKRWLRREVEAWLGERPRSAT